MEHYAKNLIIYYKEPLCPCQKEKRPMPTVLKDSRQRYLPFGQAIYTFGVRYVPSARSLPIPTNRVKLNSPGTPWVVPEEYFGTLSRLSSYSFDRFEIPSPLFPPPEAGKSLPYSLHSRRLFFIFGAQRLVLRTKVLRHARSARNRLTLR